ncbi:MAG: helix-turn-helix domain-containing protein [Methanobrevibacter sp.]|jgi:hypothetical protein|nr:helix-turn-helix domain-containing protein [Candidatus Methanovirga basalitermitum]
MRLNVLLLVNKYIKTKKIFEILFINLDTVRKIKKLYYQTGSFVSKLKYKLDWYKNTTLQILDKNNTSK